MSTLQNIRDEIEQLSERRVELWHQLSEGRDPSVAAELKELDDRIAALWDEQRQLRATLDLCAIPAPSEADVRDVLDALPFR